VTQNARDVPTLFMGSPHYAVTILETLVDNHHNIIGVVTQPDKRVGRGRKFQSPPVKVFADQLDIPVVQPGNLKRKSFNAQLEEMRPGLIIVAAYGKILPGYILNFPKWGCINVHGSLLPRWRGASPVQAAILHGDTESGVTIMKMDEGIDTGDVLSQKSISLDEDETSQTLMKKIAEIGAELLVNTISNYISGELTPIKQPDKGATYAGLIQKKDGLINFKRSAQMIERKVRALQPWPIAYFDWNGKNVKLFSAKILNTKQLAAGQRGKINKYPCIGTKTHDLLLLDLKVPGKRRLDGKVFLNGARDWVD